MKKSISYIALFLCICLHVASQEISINSADACYNSNTGSMEINFDQYAEDYTLPFSGNYYNITTGDYEDIIVESNPLILTNLAAGEYEFQIFISDDEIMEFCWEVYEYKIADEITIDTYNADCLGDNGRIVINASSTLIGYGTPILATVFDNSGEEITSKYIHTGLTLIKDLEGKNYSLKIELPNGCTDFIQFFIEEDQLKIPFDIISTNKSCEMDGGIDINVDSGNGPFMIQWKNVDTEEEYFSEDLQNVTNGIYCLSINKIGSKINCEYTDTCLVVESSILFQDIIINHVCDSLSTDGSIIIDTKHDSYTYKWDIDPPHTGSTLEDIGPGKYCVVVTNADNCKHHECFTIEALPDTVEITYDIVRACPAIVGGMITLNIEPFTDNTIVSWDDLPSTEENLLTRADLVPGEYLVTVSNECSTSQKTIVLGYDCTCPEWQEFVPTYKKKADCDDGSIDGNINFIQSAGYSFEWSNGATDAYIYGLSEGTYTVTITHDDSQCDKTISIDLINIAAAEVSFSDINSACPLGGLGEVAVSISGSFFSFYWDDIVNSSNQYFMDNLAPGEYTLVLSDACGVSNHMVNIPAYEATLLADEFVGCDPFSEITFEFVGDNPPFEVKWETGDSGSLKNVAPGDYQYTITDAKGCEYIDEFTILNPLEILSQVKPCPDINNGSITFQINNPNKDFLQVTYDFGACGECDNFPLIEPTYDSILVIELDNLPGEIPFVFEIDFGGCHFTREFKLTEELWDKEFVSSEEIDGIIYCTYDKVCRDIVIEDGYVEPATLDHFSQQGAGWTLQGFGSCGETNLVCGQDSVGVLSEDPILMRALEARVFYNKLGIAFDYFWEQEIDKNPCRYAWVCPNGTVYPSFFSGNFFGGGQFEGTSTLDQEEGCQEIGCKYDFGLFSFHDNFVICDSFEFLPAWIEPYVNNSGDESEEKCEFSKQLDAFSIINFYRNWPTNASDILEDSELLTFILDNIDNPAQNCASVTYCLDDYSVLHTDIDDIDCDTEILQPPLILDDDGNTIYAQSCESYKLDDDNVYILCPTDCGPKSEDILGCWYINIVPIEADLPGIVNPNGGPKSQNRNIVIQPQSKPTSFYTFTQYITKYGELIYKPLLKTDEGHIRLNLLSQGSYETFPLDDIIFSHEDFRDGYHFTLSGKDGNYIMSSGHFSDIVSHTVVSSDYLKILSHSFAGGITTITGEFQGQLEVNNEVILNFNDKTPFSLKIDKMLNILDLDYIDESTNLVLHSNGKFLEVETIGGNDLADIKIENGINILKYHFDMNSNTEYLIAKGAGLISSNTINVNLQNDNSLTLLAIQNETIIWSKKFGDFNEVSSDVAITTNENQEIFVGLSFKHQLEIENLTIAESNQNSFDNIILRFTKSGALEAYQLISNKSDELIAEMRNVNNEIVVGITSKGYEYKREIGEKVFYQFDSMDSRGLTSHIKVDQMNLFAHNRTPKNEKNELFRIIPNPSSERIKILLAENAQDIEQIQIFNINGKLVYNIDTVKSNSKIIDITPMITGVYTVKVTNNKQQIFTKKLIITK